MSRDLSEDRPQLTDSSQLSSQVSSQLGGISGDRSIGAIFDLSRESRRDLADRDKLATIVTGFINQSRWL